MSAILTIITPELIDRYTDGELSGKDKRTVETAIATDTRARDAAIQSLCAKVGLSPGLYGPGSYLENRKERDRYSQRPKSGDYGPRATGSRDLNANEVKRRFGAVNDQERRRPMSTKTGYENS